MRQSLVAAFGAVVMSMGSLVAAASVTTVSASAATSTAAKVTTAWPPQIAVAYVVGGADYRTL